MSNVSQKTWELPARAGEIITTLFLGMFFGVILGVLGVGFLSPEPPEETTTTAVVPPSITATTGPIVTVVPDDPAMSAKCGVFVESFREYGTRTNTGPITPDDLEFIVDLCLTDGFNTDLIPKGKIARLETECELWVAGQEFADAYARVAGIPRVALSPCPPSSGGPPPVMK